MIEISTRHLLAALILTLVALVPVSIHSYVGRDSDDCADPAALLQVGKLPGSFDVRERWETRRKAWLQQTQGKVEPSGFGVEPMDFRIVRSMKPRRIYLRPTTFLPDKLEPDEIELRWVEAGGERLPIHTGVVFHHSRKAMQVASWMYIYEGRPIAHPFQEQVASALPQLFSGTRPLTLILVSGYAPRHRIDRVTGPADEWLAAAWRNYASVCGE